MQYHQNHHMWTDPEEGLQLKYHHLSYIVFRTDGGDAVILAARCPDMARFAVGQNIAYALNLDDEAQLYVFGSENQPPLVVRTNVGVGILDKRYHRHAGIGVYWHIHGEPDSLARLVNSGVLGDPEGGRYRISRAITEVKGRVKYSDTPSYEALADAWSRLERSHGETIPPSHGALSCDEDGCLYVGEVFRMAEDTADFVGCSVKRSWDDFLEEGTNGMAIGRVKCRRPVLLEALLLCLLTEARTYSADGKAVCSVGTLGNLDGEGLVLELTYSMEKPEKHAAELDIIHRHLSRVGDLGGLALHADVVRLKRGERQEGKLPRMQITLEWLRDPAVLPTSDLKADVELADDANHG